jgi:hypothetical protein
LIQADDDDGGGGGGMRWRRREKRNRAEEGPEFSKRRTDCRRSNPVQMMVLPTMVE